MYRLYGMLLFVVLSFTGSVTSDTLELKQNGESRMLTLDNRLILIDYNGESRAALDDIIQSYEEIDDNYLPQEIVVGKFETQLNVGVDIEIFMAILNLDSRVTSASRVAIGGEGYKVYLTNEFTVEYPEYLSFADLSNILGALGLDVIPMGHGLDNFGLATFEPGYYAVYDELASQVNALSLGLDFRPALLVPIRVNSAPNDPYWLTQQPYLHTDFQNLEDAYDFTLTDDSVKICFLEDGIEDHEDLPQPFDITAENYAGGTPGVMTVYDESFHGFAVISVCYAQIGNNLGISGYNNDNFVIRNHQIYILPDMPDEVYVTDYGMYWAIDSAANWGADIISISWDDPDNQLTYLTPQAIELAYDSGVFIVAASGNCPTGPCDSILFPGNDSHVFTVGGLNRSHTRHQFSVYDSTLDAMGYFDVLTIDQMDSLGTANPDKGPLCSNWGNDNYDCHSGTSYCSPQAAGIAGMVLARRPDLKNQPDVLMEILRMTTNDGDTTCALDSSWNIETGYGRMDASRALLSVSRGDVNNDATINITDATYLNAYMFLYGPAPVPLISIADSDCDCDVDISDLTFLIDYLFRNGPAPDLCYKF